MTGEGLEALVADLGSTKVERRAKAWTAVWGLIDERKDPAALERLASLLEPRATGADATARAQALQMIGTIRGEAALRLLETHVADPAPEVRAAVGDVAEDLGEAGKPLLRRLVADPDFGVRFWAAVSLSEQGEAGGYDALVEGLAGSETRFEALQGLRRLGDPRAEPAVRKVLDKWLLDPIDRVAALGALARLGDRPSAEALVKELERRRADVRGLAMQIAGELNLAEALPALERLFRDKAADARGAAAMGLGATRQERYVTELSAVLLDEQEGPDLRGDVAWALQLSGGEAALKALREAEPRITRDDVRQAVREALRAGA